MTRDKRWPAKFSGFVSWWKQFLSLKNCRSVCICSVLNRSNRDTTVYYRLIFCAFSWPNMVKWHNSLSSFRLHNLIKDIINLDGFLYCLHCSQAPWRTDDADILLSARIFPCPCGAQKNTPQLAKYPRVLYVKPLNKMYLLRIKSDSG